MPILSGTLGAGFLGKASGNRFWSFPIANTTGSVGFDLFAADLDGFVADLGGFAPGFDGFAPGFDGFAPGFAVFAVGAARRPRDAFSIRSRSACFAS
jgi:hypothetical protein